MKYNLLDTDYFGDDLTKGTWSSTSIEKEDSVDIPCSCGHGIIRIWKDEYKYGIVIYSYAPRSFRQRLRKAWRLHSVRPKEFRKT